MTTAVQHEAALTKLGRVMGVPVDDLAFLEDTDVVTLAALRDQISDALGRADARRLGRIMASAKLVPIPVAATIGERWFGATMCSRFVALVEPKLARQYAAHLSVAFMADITASTDPRCVGDLVYELPLATMQQIATTLLDRGDYVTLSHFVGFIAPDIVVSILDAIDDDAALVRIACFVENLDVLDPVVGLLPDRRLIALVEAIDCDDLWAEALHLFGALTPTQIARVATTLVALDQTVLATALDAFARHDLWEPGLRLIDQLGEDDMARVAAILDHVDDDIIESALAAAEANDLWPPLVRAAVAAKGRIDSLGQRLALLVERVPPEGVARFNRAALELGYPSLLEDLLATS